MLGTWKCHVCGQERPDDKIAVHSRSRPVGTNGIVFQENIRYCNDRVMCIEGAGEISFLPKEPG